MFLSVHKISLGVSCGVFASFTPFFGLHFVIAGLLSFLVRGNVVASLLGTFLGNPVTFPFITVFNLNLGSWLIGKNNYAENDGGKLFEGLLDIIFLSYKKFFTEGSFIEKSSPKANEFISNVFYYISSRIAWHRTNRKQTMEATGNKNSTLNDSHYI